ncbi:uncharacterized protein LOC119731339 [Patiria miniata]|uniref:Uncharacterized protein n=1 Tax=Patiria miniata TaxID=46514 RepID=A0A914AAH9_PATMI|nr:uncharacterized protein LOC119731339 [Patiria miniata]
MQHSEAAYRYQRTDLPTEAQLPTPATDDRTLQEVAKRLGPDWVKLAVELRFEMVEVQTIEANYAKDVQRQGLEMLVAWKQAQSTGVEQQRTTLCTALEKIGRADIAGFLHGLPAPRPQYSQRPDQEARLMDPCQEAGNKTRDKLKIFYKTTGSYVQLLPGVDNDQKHITGIYTKVQLETREGVAEVTDKKGETVNSTEYAKIFRLRTKTGELIKRLLFYGMGGVGKSTIFDKIAFDWAEEASEILKRFELVFLLKMCALSQESDLVASTFDQLLGEDSGIATDELDQFILASPNEVLILLDGFDEMSTKTLDAASFGSILKALNRTKYRECVICVSTRPSHLEKLTSKSLIQNPCTHVEVLGFTDEDVNEYIRKFYKEDRDSGKALIQTISKSNAMSDLANNPMLLLLICLLWRESKQLPKTTSRLFSAAVDYMFRRKQEISGEDVAKTLIAIGKTALQGLIGANQTFSFQEDEFESKALDLALKAGILTQQRVIKNRKSHNNIQFMHKTVQEYCAAKYLQSVHMSNRGLAKRTMYKVVQFGEFQNNLRQLCLTLEGVVSNDFLLRFCCGDNEKCMTDIVNLLDRDMPRLTDLSLADNQALGESAESWAQNLTKLRNIKTLNLSNCSLQWTHIEGIASAVSELPSLTDLILTDNPALDVSTEKLSRYLLRVKQKHTLDLSNSSLTWNFYTISCVMFVCNNIPTLTNLSLADNLALGGSAELWANTLSQLKNIEMLNLSNYIEHIASAVGVMPRLTDLILAYNTALSKSVELWAKELPKMKHLHRLDLSGCDLTPSDVEHIDSAARDMPSLAKVVHWGIIR